MFFAGLLGWIVLDPNEFFQDAAPGGHETRPSTRQLAEEPFIKAEDF